MIIYVIYEINYADFKTLLNDEMYFYGAYKNKRKANKQITQRPKKNP